MGGGVVEAASALAIGVPTWEGAALEQGHPHREPNSPPCSGHPRRLCGFPAQRAEEREGDEQPGHSLFPHLPTGALQE